MLSIQLMHLKNNADHALPAETPDGMIPGIFNYCDRWCKYCNYPVRCSVFAIGDNTPEADAQLPDTVNYMAQYIGFLVHDTMELLLSMAREQGFSDGSYSVDDEAYTKPSKDHYLVRKADEHAAWLNKWLLRNNFIYKNGGQGINEGVKIAVPVKEQLDIVHWYMNFIAVKFSRALLMKTSANYKDQCDSNGSAKIAIIAVERSIAALSELLKLKPAFEDDFLPALARLNRLKKRAMSEFPDAMQFKRPGLDD